MSKSFSISVKDYNGYQEVAEKLKELGFEETPYIQSGDAYRESDTVVTYCTGDNYFWPSSYTVYEPVYTLESFVEDLLAPGK